MVHNGVMLRGVIFDVDGVLVDSTAANQKFFQNLLIAAGYSKPSAALVNKCFHMSMYDAIKYLTGSTDESEIQRIWQMGRDTSFYPSELLTFPCELPDLLDVLNKSYLLAIATSRIKSGMDDLLTRAGVKDYFHVVVTFDDYSHPKPHPEPLQIAAARLQIAPSCAVYIGDSESDVLAATAAGMKSIYLTENPTVKADIVISSLTELPVAVEKLSVRFSGEASADVTNAPFVLVHSRGLASRVRANIPL